MSSRLLIVLFGWTLSTVAAVSCDDDGERDGDVDADADADGDGDADADAADGDDADDGPELDLEGQLFCEGAEHAVVLVDQRLYEPLYTDLNAWLAAACERRGFAIRLVGLEGLDDMEPADVRSWLIERRDAEPTLEGALLVGNVPMPTFFLSRIDTPQVRYWPRYYMDLDMVVDRTIEAGAELPDCEGEPDAGGFPPNWPCIEPGIWSVPFVVPEHDFDFFDQGPDFGPEIWAAFLPVGYGDERLDSYEGWAEQLRPMLHKALAFYDDPTAFVRNLYHVGNDLNMVAQLETVWDEIGPERIDYYAVNTMGEGLCDDNPDCYVRAPLEDYDSLDEFLGWARGLPWIGEGWQSAEIFIEHMSSSDGFPRRVVWWNVHSTGDYSLITSQQAREDLPPGSGGIVALLNGCMVGTYRRPGDVIPGDGWPVPYAEGNIMVSLVYGKSAFVAALGVTPLGTTDPLYGALLDRLYTGEYLGAADRARMETQDRRNEQAMAYRAHQNILIGDPFVDGM